MEAQVLLHSTAQDEKAKASLAEMYADPAFKALKPHEQLAKAGQSLIEKGMLDRGRQFADTAQKAEENYYQGQERASKAKERQLEHARQVISNITFETMDNALMDLQSSGNASPQEARRFGELLTQARMQGPEAFNAVKAQLTKQLGSIEANHQREVLAAAAAKEERLRLEGIAKDERDRRRDDTRWAGVMAGIGNRGDALELRREAEVRQKQEGIRQSLNRDIDSLSKRDTALVTQSNIANDNLEIFLKDRKIPEEPSEGLSVVPRWMLGGGTTKENDELWSRYNALKTTADQARKDANPADPNSVLSRVRKDIEKQRERLYDVGAAVSTTSSGVTGQPPPAETISQEMTPQQYDKLPEDKKVAYLVANPSKFSSLKVGGKTMVPREVYDQLPPDQRAKYPLLKDAKGNFAYKLGNTYIEVK